MRALSEHKAEERVEEKEEKKVAATSGPNSLRFKSKSKSSSPRLSRKDVAVDEKLKRR